jgi:Sec-independent protein translocase protein TatA
MPIDWNTLLPREGQTVMVWAAAIVVGVGGAGWGLFVFGLSEGADKAKNQLAFYQSATAAKLPELSANLVDVSNDLKKTLKVYERNRELETMNQSYQKQLQDSTQSHQKQLQETAQSYEKQLNEAVQSRVDRDRLISSMKMELEQGRAREKNLNAEIDKLKGASRRFSLHSRRAEQLIAGRSVGFSGTIGTSIARLVYDNREISASAGYTIEVGGDGKNCVLTLLSIAHDEERVDFDFTCKDSKPSP